jgi:hypothetical protein
MNTLQNIVWPFLALGAIGYFIDFYIGKAGRKQTTERLVRAWREFYAELKLSNFAAKEAMYFLRLFDPVFGSRLLSSRRLLSCLGVVVTAFVLFSAAGYAAYGSGFLDRRVEWNARELAVTYCAISVAVTTVTFALSLSLTKALSACVIKLASRWKLGPLPYIALLGVHVILLIYWTPLSGYIRFSIADHSLPSVSGLLIEARQILTGATLTLPPMSPPPKIESAAVWTDALVAFASNAVRILIALGIFVAFIFRNGISCHVDRLVKSLKEEDPPRPYTLILGAFGAIAAALNEIANRFSAH